MPIYAYKCESCGFSRDVLQKISDTPLQDCPTCGKATFKKQLTAAGFQLKGSGWYVTDFKGSGSSPAAAPAPAAADASATTGDGPAKAAGSTDAAPTGASAAAAPAAAPATKPPAAG